MLRGDPSKVVIFGGAGFIGANAAARFLSRGDRVVVFDNCSRRGAQWNLAWLAEHPHAGALTVLRGDVRRPADLDACLRAHADCDLVLHEAAQVAVTTSVTNPREDFETNALGTFNVLEAVRARCTCDPVFLFASTNKVYGGMEDLAIVERGGCYAYRDLPGGIGEDRGLDFHSPYGCSKGAADQYVRDYARIYGLRSVVLRQSCIYGRRQFGIEDQGWVAWFTIAAALGKPLTIYGDGKQVRDVLEVEDLLDAYVAAWERIDATRGRIYNIGGGPENTLSLLELLAFLEDHLGRPIRPRFADWRPGDQPVFVCDISRARAELGWAPRVGVREGVARLAAWVQTHPELFADL